MDVNYVLAVSHVLFPFEFPLSQYSYNFTLSFEHMEKKKQKKQT